MKPALEFNHQAVLRGLLALLLTWAALGKIANLQDFHANLAAYHLPLPEPLLRLAVAVVPWLELLCGILLLVTGGLRRAALLWAVLLCALFVLATGQAWARGLEISCGCFKLDFLGNGATRHALESVPFAFGRSLVLLLVALHLLRTRPPPGLQPNTSPAP
jgi:putative oxidoreductase